MMNRQWFIDNCQWSLGNCQWAKRIHSGSSDVQAMKNNEHSSSWDVLRFIVSADSILTTHYALSIICIAALCFFTSSTAHAQSGMEYEEFAHKLELYFDKELVGDIKQQLPQGAEYRIWGWDVGDFSGDGNNDVAFTLRLQNDKRRQVTVYLFADIDGYLNNVASYQNTFVDLPLEVGIVIKNNACYVTRKRKQFDWAIRGYRYSSGSVLLMDEFTTSRIEKFTHENYRNYQNLRNNERFIQTTNNDVAFSSDWLAIPCYPRGEQIYKGYASTAEVNTVDFVTKGAFYWTGEEDCSFTVRSAYDDNFLYMNIAVRDDAITTARCDTCPADYIDIWFDANTRDSSEGSRTFSRKGKQLSFRSAADSNIYRITVNLGDFLEKRPSVNVSSTEAEDAETQQRKAVQQITKKVGLRPNGYIVKIRIPFSLLGYVKAPVEEKGITEIGCAVAVHDIDNEYRPEEESTIATSQLQSMNPSSFGALVLVPQDQFYGESTNIFADALVKYLGDLGF